VDLLLAVVVLTGIDRRCFRHVGHARYCRVETISSYASRISCKGSASSARFIASNRRTASRRPVEAAQWSAFGCASVATEFLRMRPVSASSPAIARVSANGDHLCR
jgi:hypothetical protein